MQPTNDDMIQMNAENIAQGIKLALQMKKQELVIRCDDDAMHICNGTVSMLTPSVMWCRVEGLSKVEVIGSTIGIYSDDYSRAVQFEHENVTDLYWDTN